MESPIKSIPMNVPDRILIAQRMPLIIPTANPKSDRMTYVNYIRNTKQSNFLTVKYKQNDCRIIIGPKDFHLQCFVDLGTCSQEELNKAWQERASELSIAGSAFDMLVDKVKEAEEKLRNEGEEALASMGFGKKREN